jgi:hypothetical protein
MWLTFSDRLRIALGVIQKRVVHYIRKMICQLGQIFCNFCMYLVNLMSRWEGIKNKVFCGDKKDEA